MLELKNTLNGKVDQLNVLVSEVMRVAREVGTEGKLGQAAAQADAGGRGREASGTRKPQQGWSFTKLGAQASHGGGSARRMGELLAEVSRLTFVSMP